MMETNVPMSKRILFGSLSVASDLFNINLSLHHSEQIK